MMPLARVLRILGKIVHSARITYVKSNKKNFIKEVNENILLNVDFPFGKPLCLCLPKTKIGRQAIAILITR